MDINCQPENQVYEFENLEELRLFDPRYRNHSDNAAMKLVAQVFDVPESHIRDIRCLKAGMTNKSFLFNVDGHGYICGSRTGNRASYQQEQEKQFMRRSSPWGLRKS